MRGLGIKKNECQRAFKTTLASATPFTITLLNHLKLRLNIFVVHLKPIQIQGVGRLEVDHLTFDRGGVGMGDLVYAFFNSFLPGMFFLMCLNDSFYLFNILLGGLNGHA